MMMPMMLLGTIRLVNFAGKWIDLVCLSLSVVMFSPRLNHKYAVYANRADSLSVLL